MGLYYNRRKVRNLYYNGKCITRLALGKGMTRLVEGDDFVRAEWLVGDGTAYIDTGHNTDERLDFETEVVCPDTELGTHFFWFRYGAYDGDTVMIARTNNNTYIGYRVANNSNQVYWNNTAEVTEIKCYGNLIIINGTTYTVTNSYLLRKPFYLYYISLEQGTATPSTSNNVKCSYFRLLDSNGNYIQNLIPCRLLRPIPSTLDANGIARNAGECGMFDAVSGKFFGNVASSGSFTVSDN